MHFLDIFPVHVLEMIFSNFSKGDLLDASLISPTANRFISNSRNLMRNWHFRTKGDEQWPPLTRKYTKLDICDTFRLWAFPDLPLTELTIDHCAIEPEVLHNLLEKVSDTLELIVINDIRLYERDYRYFDETEELPPSTDLPSLHFPKLRTLILVDMFPKARNTLLVIIKATSLIELGMVKVYRESVSFAQRDAKLFLELIKINPKIKKLHLAPWLSELFLRDALEHPEVQYEFEELGIFFLNPWTDFRDVLYVEIFWQFLESQPNLRKSLKTLLLGKGFIAEEYAEKLLSLNLTRLEFHRCTLAFSSETTAQNNSIESLSFIGFYCLGESSPDSLCKFVKCCKNLAAFEAGIEPKSENIYPDDVQTWELIDNQGLKVKRICWSDLRGLHFTGLAIAHAFVRFNPYYRYYRHKLKEVTVEQHPNLMLEFRKVEKSVRKRLRSGQSQEDEA